MLYTLHIHRWKATFEGLQKKKCWSCLCGVEPNCKFTACESNRDGRMRDVPESVDLSDISGNSFLQNPPTERYVTHLAAQTLQPTQIFATLQLFRSK